MHGWTEICLISNLKHFESAMWFYPFCLFAPGNWWETRYQTVCRRSQHRSDKPDRAQDDNENHPDISYHAWSTGCRLVTCSISRWWWWVHVLITMSYSAYTRSVAKDKNTKGGGGRRRKRLFKDHRYNHMGNYSHTLFSWILKIAFLMDTHILILPYYLCWPWTGVRGYNNLYFCLDTKWKPSFQIWFLNKPLWTSKQMVILGLLHFACYFMVT